MKTPASAVFFHARGATYSSKEADVFADSSSLFQEMQRQTDRIAQRGAGSANRAQQTERNGDMSFLGTLFVKLSGIYSRRISSTVFRGNY